MTKPSNSGDLKSCGAVEQLFALRINTLAHISVQLSNGKRLHDKSELQRELARQEQGNGYAMFPNGRVV